MALLVPVSWGELIDKITILQIKRERLDNGEKLVNVNTELDELKAAVGDFELLSSEVRRLMQELYEVNCRLWDIEDNIRLHEKQQQFNDSFIRLARSVYKINDQRAALKYQINMLSGSNIVEEKSYQDYG